MVIHNRWSFSYCNTLSFNEFYIQITKDQRLSNEIWMYNSLQIEKNLFHYYKRMKILIFWEALFNYKYFKLKRSKVEVMIISLACINRFTVDLFIYYKFILLHTRYWRITFRQKFYSYFRKFYACCRIFVELRNSIIKETVKRKPWIEI